jgi:HD superfamily phosphohydrolase
MDILDFSSTLRDPIWGDIAITKTEEAVINTHSFKRLRHIKQMSLSYLGHPGAQHTRFEHSIGCCHVASALVTNIQYIGPRDRGDLQDFNTK